MSEALNNGVGLPSTRFVGSKRQIAPWLHTQLKQLEFDNALDVFGGTGSVSYLMKKLGKQVYFNDYMGFSQDLGRALISNNTIKIDNSDLEKVSEKVPGKSYENIIRDNFKGIYYTEKENEWLDVVIQNILDSYSGEKKCLLLASLYQACLAKRPFNLFHRKNLYMRLNDVERSFGNKKSWDASFEEKFREFANEYNNHVFDNGEDNEVIGGFDGLNVPPQDVELVYLDPPYISRKRSSGPNYLTYYHFLEGLRDYYNWEKKIDYTYKTNKFQLDPEVSKWTHKTKIEQLLIDLIRKYSDSIIVLSYRQKGIPSISEIEDIFVSVTGDAPKIEQTNHSYALSSNNSSEVLFISE